MDIRLICRFWSEHFFGSRIFIFRTFFTELDFPQFYRIPITCSPNILNIQMVEKKMVEWPHKTISNKTNLSTFLCGLKHEVNMRVANNGGTYTLCFAYTRTILALKDSTYYARTIFNKWPQNVCMSFTDQLLIIVITYQIHNSVIFIILWIK